jgi:two-component system response regulator VicR
MNTNILLVDDDTDLTMVTADYLEDAGFSVHIAVTAAEALNKMDNIHLILLDIGLPDGTGFELCKRLRQASPVPVIFISGRTGETDKMEGLDIGGDDYIPKPYSLGELLSRVKARLRRCYPQRERFGDIEVDIGGRKVWRQGTEVVLSAKEFDLLSVLLHHKNIALSKDFLLSKVWGEESEYEPSTLAVHIRWLREKLEDNPSVPKLIKTVYRVGYILEVLS